jgi:restriction alleviation protein, Lar family
MVPHLKPCPFCGCEKILDGYIRDGREIVCSECRASVAAFHPDASKRAAERWNRRSEPALSAAEPVAWQYSKGDKLIITTYHQPWKTETGWAVTPLYAAPPAPSVAVKAILAELDNVLVNDEQDRETLAKIRTMVSALSAQVQDVAEIRTQAIEDVLSALTAHELYQYRPKAFQGFIDYARSSLINDEDGKLWRPAAAPAKQEG